MQHTDAQVHEVVHPKDEKIKDSFQLVLVDSLWDTTYHDLRHINLLQAAKWSITYCSSDILAMSHNIKMDSITNMIKIFILIIELTLQRAWSRESGQRCVCETLR